MNRKAEACMKGVARGGREEQPAQDEDRDHHPPARQVGAIQHFGRLRPLILRGHARLLVCWTQFRMASAR
jgi:hypothetical protein